MNFRLGLAAGGVALAMSAPAWATITIDADPPFPPNPPLNVLLNTGSSGNTVLGTTNQQNVVVTFTGNEALIDPPNGQARVQAVDNSFNFLNIALQNPNLGMTAIEFNLDALTTGPATLTFFDQFGASFPGTFTLNQNGQNFFTTVASNGELIRNVQINSTVGLADIQQVRIGVATIPAVIPEPATWGMMILGFFGMGATLRSRRRTKGLVPTSAKPV